MAPERRQWDEHESNLHFAGMTREFIAAGIEARSVIEAGLARVCRWSESDRAHFDLSPEQVDEPGWSASSVPGDPEQPTHVTARLLAEPEVHRWFHAQLAKGNDFVVSAATPVPEEAVAERRLFEEAGTASVLFVPIALEGRMVSCLTIESDDAEAVWPLALAGRLRTMAEVYSSVARRTLNSQARRRAEQRFEALAGFSHHIVCEFNATGEMTFASRSTKDVLGIAPEAVLGFGYLDLVHPDDRERAAAALVLTPDLEVEQLTVRLRRSDGAYAWMDVEGSSFPGSAGPRRILAVLRDVTERHERQSELKEHLSIEREVTRLSKEFVGLESASLAEAFQNALQASAGIAGCDECYVVGVMEDLNAGVPQIHSWGRPRNDARKIDIDASRIAQFRWIRHKLERGDPVVVPDVEALPDEAAAERDSLRDGGIGSYLALPLRDGTRTVGVLGFSTFGRKARWGDHQLTMLRLVAELFGAVFRRARSEAHVREREERFRVLADQSPDPIIELDDRGQILFASVDFAGLLGDPDEDWVGRYLAEFVVPEDLVRANEVRDEAVSGGRVPPSVFQCRHQDGTPRFLEATVRSFETVKGARHGLATLRDVTAKLESERTLEQQIKLERQIVQISSDFMGRRVDELVNGVKRAMGIVANLAQAQRCAVISLGARPGAPNEVYQWAADGLPNDTRHPIPLDPHAFPALTRALMKGERFSVPSVDRMPDSAMVERGEMQRQGIKSFLAIPFMVRRRLAGVFVLATVSREVSWSDEDTTLLSLASDILHGALRRRQLALDLEQSQRQLLQSQKMEAVGTLAGGIAHDFNNQLAVMLGNVRFVLERQTESADTREALQDLERAAEHCAQLTRSLLAFSRRGVQERRTLSVVDWLDEVGELVKPLLPSNIDLDIRVDQSAGAVHGDETQLQQVVVNLLVNARDAMPDGGRVRVRAERKQISDAVAERLSLSGRDMVEISVGDDGEGMTAAVRERIFEPFFTTKPMGQGTGLGLATVYGIVQQCGGGVEVESSPGDGATFRVYLPAETAVAATPSMPEDTAAGGRRSVETILLVEDEPAVRRVVKRMLGIRAKHVLEARDGREALELVGDRLDEIDLLVTDMVMPRMGGLALARQIAERRPDLPTLFLSGYPDDELDFEDEPWMYHRFLQKPFTERDLSLALEALLEALP